ncbi:MAG: ATP-NAD kinase family protein [Candidatus Poseidoniaceae archaeon]|nr:ATP-NAD kinase family protein [Candidatus Poseidoniaceae archaeon]
MLVGVLVNPDAGLGGRLGFKGSDGRAKEAREAGAEDRAGPRMNICLERLQVLLDQRGASVQFLVAGGRMGADWIPQGISFQASGDYSGETNDEDTAEVVEEFLRQGVDLILYAGGDGTTRDIVNALGENRTPLVGVPGGVKMHSGCFAATPRAAAEVVNAYQSGELMLANTEVMDLDEEVYQQGEWRVRMFGEAMTPASPRWMQGAKEQIESASEEETIEGLAEHIKGLNESDSDLLIIWGSGGTLRTLAEMNGISSTLLGIDISIGGEIHNDLNEAQILEILGNHEGPRLLLLSPMGGQGFLIGRGNLQISPAVIRVVGLDDILGIVTPAKLLTLDTLRIDTGDAELDAEFLERKYVKLLQGYRTTRIMRVAED